MGNKSLSKGGLYYLIYNVLNIAFPFLTGIYVSRILLPESIGTVAAAQNLAQYFVILAFLGIPTYGLREISKNREDYNERSKVYSELYIINFVSTVFFLSVYLYIVFSVQTYRNQLTLYLVVGISIALNAFNIGWLFEGMEEFQFISIRNTIFKAVSFTLLVIFVRSEGDILLYALVTVIGTAGNCFINMIYAPRYVHFVRQGLNLRRHMKSIFYLVAVNLAIELYSLVDITMMNFMCNKDSIAFYKYGRSIEAILLQVVNTFTMVLVPRISFYYKEKKTQEFNNLLSKGLKLVIICALPMIVGLYSTADFLIVKLYGEPYIVSAGILKWLSLLLLISPIGYLLGSRVLLVTGNENRMIIPVGIGAVVNVIGNALLIPLYAEYGATIASVFSEIIVMVVYVLLGKKHYSLKGVWNCVLKVIVSCSIMGGYLFVVGTMNRNGWIVTFLQIAGAIVLYGVMLLILRENIARDYFEIIIKRLRKG